MASSGTRMVEVGTTNRTHLEDYRRAINANTRLLMRVHPSNYRIVGFASSPARAELVALGREENCRCMKMRGSGLLEDLRKYGVVDEPVVREIVEQGVDVVSFSGDKLLGSVQAGLIVGKRRNRFAFAQTSALPRIAKRQDQTRGIRGNTRFASARLGVQVPVMQMLSLTADELRAARAKPDRRLDAKFELIAGESTLGGGSGPTSTFPTTLIAITHPAKSAQDIEHELRTSSPAIIARISEGKVLLDLSTVFDGQLQYSGDTLKSCRGGTPWPPRSRIDRFDEGRPRSAAPTINLWI